MQPVIYTIGHSNRSIDNFRAILASFAIELVADIRSLPGSKKYPHFDKDQLAVYLPEQHIAYRHFPDLGGRRNAAKNSSNTNWRNLSFRGYADYMDTLSFKKAVTELETIAADTTTAYMCSEAVWWRCHRSMISDYLKLKGWQVRHIMDIGKYKEHPYTAPANIIAGKLTYSGNNVNL